MPERVIVYIDGFNLYFGIRASGLGRYLWLDLCRFGANLIRPGQQLVAVRYFTSRISGPESKRKRQSTYLDALATLDPSMLSIAYGNYQAIPFRCPQCGASWDTPNEKQTDVNIAVAMLADAFQHRFEVALLVSADSDLRPAVATVRALFPSKGIVVCFPPGRAYRPAKSRSHFSPKSISPESNHFPETTPRNPHDRPLPSPQETSPCYQH